MDTDRFLLLCLPSSWSSRAPHRSPSSALISSALRRQSRLQGQQQHLGRRAGKPMTDSSQEGTAIPASVKWIQGWALEQGSKFSSGEQPQLQPNPIFRPLSEGQALQHSPAQLLLKTPSGFNITSWEFHQAKALSASVWQSWRDHSEPQHCKWEMNLSWTFYRQKIQLWSKSRRPLRAVLLEGRKRCFTEQPDESNSLKASGYK